MPKAYKLSELAASVREAIEEAFGFEAVWVTAQLSDVKIQAGLRRCYLRMIERTGEEITTDFKANIWTKSFSQIEEFERATGQKFRDGLEVTAQVAVRYNPRYGLSLEILKLDIEWTLGSLERERQQTLDRLLKEHPDTIQLEDGEFNTYNKQLRLPLVARRIALVTAPDSDGRRDFLEELKNNRHGFTFQVTDFLTTIQGDRAHLLMVDKLEEIRKSRVAFDLVCIVRGGGSQTDLKPFDQYELAKTVAEFPIPVLTGIGHDRNTSITDLMARQEKTPTKVAACVVDLNARYEDNIIQLHERGRLATAGYFRDKGNDLNKLVWQIRTLHPRSTLNRGFAMVECDGKVVTGIEGLRTGAEILTHLMNGTISSIINEINETQDETAGQNRQGDI